MQLQTEMDGLKRELRRPPFAHRRLRRVRAALIAQP